MTDEQIIKALECCEVGKDKCKKCPLYCNVPACSRYLAQFALDLIKRQQARIEQEVDLNREMFEKMARDEAEIERLEADREALINGQTTLQKMYAEAIKKFAERLKEKAEYYSDLPFKTVDVEDIDNLVKEMTEGKDDE